MKTFSWSDKPSATAFPIAQAGYPIIFAAALTTFVLALLSITWAAIAALVITFFICFFFRDPDRVIPDGENLVVSPADGKVISIIPDAENPHAKGRWTKVSIFMSVFNVHVNRAPLAGKITKISYFPGKFFSANLDKASKENEHNALLLKSDQDQMICFVQIAGLIARRIICKVQEGEEVKKGQRFGMICFGSRLDVYLPVSTSLKVSKGDKVSAGVSALGELI